MDAIISILRVLHVITAVLMAWPFYALVAVNQRMRLGPPLGDRVDTYLENTLKNRVFPCYVFQATALATGLALILLRGMGLDTLVTNPVLGLKFLLLLVIAGLLTVVTFSLQPRLDALFARCDANGKILEAEAAQIRALRGRRKQLSSLCMFCVLTAAMLGVQTWAAFPVWLTIVLIAAMAIFTWRAYTSVTPWGWA
ncbi:MAG: hypothetical protein DPW09_19250 [Anaerolineae bacterium]|nr:hypothetical protein [Anaerolineae bacterium]MCQ3975579.1 hypothetical protein [Anaerolineae bacterium]